LDFEDQKQAKIPIGKAICRRRQEYKKMPKREQKVDLQKYARHRGHDDSHRAMMGTDLAPKEAHVSSQFLKQI
jgi:chorismate-pyruvate lyase